LLERLLLPFRLGLGGRLGNGRMWMSCIALPDLVDVFRFALTDDGLAGAVNAVGPTPVRNEEFSLALGRLLHRPVLTAVPEFALRLLLGAQQANEMALASQRVVPRALERAGYRFAHPTIDDALRAALVGTG
jgi:NAD dependent epimerase/dehydratase family enzyme